MGIVKGTGRLCKEDRWVLKGGQVVLYIGTLSLFGGTRKGGARRGCFSRC